MAPMRRKSQGSIRSPHVKRNIQSQVTLEGWLFKLEGGALKQWKQRWCVLVDFCLFFYKAPREEKVTSSILLPSYKINPCASTDKISKKFAFKAEHQNMKTYYFAAEDKESMKKWMNAMSLASIMQKFVKSENSDPAFSSTYNDDEDSGFTSYRSRRHPSNRSSSVHNSTSCPEPLKQRSNSCGDRVGEIYLGSDDKYPNVYRNTTPHTNKMPQTQQDVPRKQPLYANAPPKPRRLTQTDSFPLYPSECYDTREPDLILESSQYNLDYPIENRFINPENSMQYLPMETDANNSFTHSTSSHPESSFMQSPTCVSTVPDIYRSKPPRPRSADFLERDSECIVPTYTSQYSENPLLQRPKSSLECYNRDMDSEEYDFDDYREAVRVQADNLYANKNLLRNKNLEYPSQTENVTKSDPRLNAHYVSQNSSFSSDPISSCLPSNYMKEEYADHYPKSSTISHYRGHLDSQSPKSAQNESMQRLLEWKQRMLQSPLSRRNQLHSTSSDASSANSSKHIDSNWKSLKHDAYNQNRYQKQGKNWSCRDPNSTSFHHENYGYSKSQYESAYSNISDKPALPYHIKDKHEPQHVSDDVEKSHRSLTDSADNLYRDNIMYCVDSENNEILFSYDTSPTHAPSPFHSSHYPPQMHSFSTLPNVNDIGMETVPGSAAKPQPVKSRHFRSERNQAKQDPSTAGNERGTEYSSDDEDVIEDSDFKDTSLVSKEIIVEPPCHSEEKYFDERYHSSSPDYVNIGAMYRDLDPDSVQEMYSSDSVFKGSVEVNQAVLKQLEQVSKSNNTLPKFNQSSDSITTPLYAPETSSTKPYLNPNFHETTNCHEKDVQKVKGQDKKNSRSTFDFNDDMECDIKREDYYRASQIFYSSMRMKNKLGVSPSKSAKVNSPSTSEHAFQYYPQDKAVVRSVKNVACIDKDVGLPLPANINILSNRKSIDKVSEISVESDRDNRSVIIHENHPDKPKSSGINDLIKKDDVVNKGFSKEIEILNSKMKKSLTYEEMRGQLLRKREAPPPNIVQERIKTFEKVEKIEENKGSLLPSHAKLTNNDLHTNKYANRSFSRRNRLKNSRSRNHKRLLHSDSEAIAFDDSDASSDDLTMKSAPILLSPLSSVLADLRKTADSGKDKTKQATTDNAIPELSAIKTYPGSSSKHSASVHTENRFEKSIPAYDLHCDSSSEVQNFDDAVYLPMYGIKAIKEPEYVMMSGSKSSPNVSGLLKQKSKYNEEHVYNEPFSPPPSFLHDVYGKQKTKQFQYQLESSSSEDSLTENIYEKPMQRFSSDISRNIKNDYMVKTAQETNFVLMNSKSCSNVTTLGHSDNVDSRKDFPCTFNNKSKSHHYEQAHLSVSVPDLLQLQEIKDSDASDADDEASRDFDTAGSSHLSSYQSTVLDHFYVTNVARSVPPDSCSVYDSESTSITSKESYIDACKINSSDLQKKESLPHVKCMPSYETVSIGNSDASALPVLDFKSLETAKADLSDSEKQIHVRKLRVYTKGKKPEAPKIFPVPFNLEETELKQTSERKGIRTLESDGLSYSKNQASKTDNFPLSDNVAYVSREEFGSPRSPVSQPNVPFPPPSYAPDIISSIKEEERMPSDSASPFSKSPNSAPYYYSDLYSGHGINFAGHLPLFKQNEVPYSEKTSLPKSCTSLLNNIRPKSPCTNKGDVGRKVNNINVEIREKQVFNDKPILKYLKDETKSNLRHSLDVFQVSESKFLDAEKNKYEAGSTLEKTRPTHTMSYFKHRASTPELNLCQHQSDEPVYENLMFLSKRVSQSLEAIPNAPELLDEHKLQGNPVYENIEFFNKREVSNTSDCSFVKQLPSSEYAKSLEDPSDINVSNKRHYSSTKQCESSRKSSSTILQQTNDSEINFLDQDVLRRVSKQHFYPKGFRNKLSDRDIDTYSKDGSQNAKCSLNIQSIKDSCSYQVSLNADTPVLKEIVKYKMIDSDSTSDATSSCDEASVDSDYRHRPSFGKVNFEDRHSSISGCELTAKEANYLKKLFQQSHGLMCKGKQLSVSAGDLLGKTHEELVLLLIQLRRNQCKIFKAKEKLEHKLRKERDGLLQMEHQQTSQHYEELHKQILHLEKQYEVTQPLVTLVDNMVKLGSLYGSSNRRSLSLPILDCTSEETSPSPKTTTVSHQTSILSNLLNEETDLQKRINEINNLEKGLQSETNSISSLHQDKEMLEYTLYGMRNKILDHQDKPAELQKLRKQQRMIEKELIRVKRLLCTSAKKIEDAASKNDQMEQEILHLRQILQQALKTGSSEMKSSQHNRADLEAELTRLQSVLDELANHRHEINNTVEKLKSESCLSRTKGAEVRASPTGVAGSAPLPLRKKQHSMYLETDLDTMVTRDLSVSYERDLDDIPVYANAEEITFSNEDINFNEPSSVNDGCRPSSSQADVTDPELHTLQDINEADERMKRFYGILPKEKPSEIKTVRIVKRQSERRSRERDRKKVTYDDQSSVWVMEEHDISSDDYLEMEEVSSKKTQPLSTTRPSSINLSGTTGSCQSGLKTAHERLFGTSRPMNKVQVHSTKKPKRRHYTVSGYQYLLDPQFAQYFTERPRSRDDVDMERCLRTANTPDIVRSTIKKNDVFDDKLIDRELGLPQKIEIPERYVEIEPEQLSATEKLQRSLKAENICKMLSETTTPYQDVEKRNNSPEALHKKLSEEKRKRAQLLSLNQALAREVVERSKAVAANIYPLENQATS